MVVSVKSIPQEDLSGEGTVNDYSRTVWPRQVLEVKGKHDDHVLIEIRSCEIL